jgi:hypothetical protein
LVELRLIEEESGKKKSPHDCWFFYIVIGLALAFGALAIVIASR